MYSNNFVYRSYTKEELAKLYLPAYARATAIKKFNSWLNYSPKLLSDLSRMGVSIHTRVYTAMQVRRIVEHLGEP